MLRSSEQEKVHCEQSWKTGGTEGRLEWKTELRWSETSLVVQWPGLYAPNAGDPGSIPGQGTRSHIMTKDPMHHNKDTANTGHSQINK